MTKSNDELKACEKCGGKHFIQMDCLWDTGLEIGKPFCVYCSGLVIRPTVTTTDGDSYTPDQERVAKFLFDEAGIGGGDDPIGFIIASHRELARQRNALQSTRKPPTKPREMVCSGDYACGGKCKNCKPDDVTVSRGVLQGVRENLELIANVYTNDRHIPADTEAANALHGSLSHCDDLARQALATLDAVLAEGK